MKDRCEQQHSEHQTRKTDIQLNPQQVFPEFGELGDYAQRLLIIAKNPAPL
jgi:hypothetical protein